MLNGTPAPNPTELEMNKFGPGGGCGKRRHFVELEDLPWWPRLFRKAIPWTLLIPDSCTGIV
jgi:hypothetical protein